MKKSRSVNSNDKFHFMGDIVFEHFKEGWLVVSVQSANWLVLQSDFQKNILEQLIAGNTVGEIVALAKTENDIKQIKMLFAAIFARQFANTEENHNIKYLEGYKMLNCYLTNACNLRCEHCFMRSGIKLKDELSFDDWKHVLKEFRNEDGESVTFTGGEPLMNIYFEELVKFAYSIGLSVTVLTNGTLWTKEKIDSLSSYISEIQISIDGVDEHTNAIIRGGNHFEKVKNIVIYFANKGVRTSVATTFTFKNIEDDLSEKYKQFVLDIKEQCNYPVFFKLSKKILKGREVDYSESDNSKYYKYIFDIEQNLDKFAQYNNFMEGHIPNLVERNCGFGGISIAANGEVYFCNRISEVESYGNVRTQSIKQFIEKGRKLHLETSVDTLIPCKDCYLRYICNGGCRIDDCNFKGKLQNHKGELRQIKCNKEYIMRLEQKMIDSFLFYYKF